MFDIKHTLVSTREDLRSAYSMIVYTDGVDNPQTPIQDADPNDCLVGGQLNVTRPTGPLVEPAQ